MIRIVDPVEATLAKGENSHFNTTFFIALRKTYIKKDVDNF